MNQNNNNLSSLFEKDPKKASTIIVIVVIMCCIFPVLFLILPIVIVAIVASKKKNDEYSADHRTNISGSGDGVREEILAHEKPIDYNKSTYEIYNELINKKTDYSGVNKDLL